MRRKLRGISERLIPYARQLRYQIQRIICAQVQFIVIRTKVLRHRPGMLCLIVLLLIKADGKRVGLRVRGRLRACESQKEEKSRGQAQARCRSGHDL